MALLNSTKVSIAAGTGETLTWKVLPSCHSLPDFGADPEAVQTTTLDDTIHTSEEGIGDPGTLEFGFRLRSGATESFAILKGMRETGSEAGYTMKVEMKSGLEIIFQINSFALKVTGGGVNDVSDFTMTCVLKSDFSFNQN